MWKDGICVKKCINDEQLRCFKAAECMEGRTGGERLMDGLVGNRKRVKVNDGPEWRDGETEGDE